MKNSILVCLIFGLAVNLYAQNQQIISRLEIIDIETKERTLVRQFDYNIQAPNWTPDGKFLVYNSRGLMYKIPVEGGVPVHINTGNILSCNNDHIISFDGNTLAISARGPAGGSQVYVLPFSGGEPRLVTPNAPSYLHGISPDGSYLAYCAGRNNNMDVYVTHSSGGEEIRLTDAEGLDDGPEYSPDGNHIWFNSVRTGLMQVWRMNADGSEQTQMTYDESNSWFPHVSPDGEKVVYINYYKGDVDPGSHPANRNVELRMMSSKGGNYETLVKLFGGQGTFNVNSWSPDSKKFAFVSYEIVDYGMFERSTDIGNPKNSGSGVYNPENNMYTLTGSGINMWGRNDQFHFMCKEVSGDFTISTRIAFEGEGAVAHRKMGIMFRDNLRGNSSYADVVVHGDGLTSLQYRLTKGAITNEIKSDITGADQIVLERRGDKIIIRTAVGDKYAESSPEIEMTMPQTCYVGLFICSHDADVIEKGYFYDVSLAVP